jgi:hypothetical protein
MRKGRVQVRSWAGREDRRSRIAPTESLLDTELARLREKQARILGVLPWEQKEAAGDGGEEASAPDKLSAVAVIGAVAAAVVLLIGNWYVLQQVDLEGPLVEEVSAGEEQAGPAFPVVTIHSAREVARLFLEAPTEKDRLKWARDLPGLRGRTKNFPDEAVALPVVFEELTPMGKVEATGGFEFNQFAVRMPGGSMRLVCVVWTDDGLRVDWDSFARYSTADWDALLSGGVEEAELRVFIRPVEYYLGDFADDSRWQSFEMVSPDWPQSLYAYAAKGSPTAAVLADMVRSAPHFGRVTVRVKAGTEPERRQVEIAKLLGTCWVQGEDDPEEAYSLRQMMASE